MRTVAAIFSLFLLMSIQTPVGQLFKLPLLIEHFIKHQKQDGVSIIGFLEDHYTTSHKDADLPDDEELPFKSITFYSIDFAVVPGVLQPNVFVSLPPDKKASFPQTYIPQQNLGSVFHPPKL